MTALAPLSRCEICKRPCWTQASDIVARCPRHTATWTEAFPPAALLVLLAADEAQAQP